MVCPTGQTASTFRAGPLLIYVFPDIAVVFAFSSGIHCECLVVDRFVEHLRRWRCAGQAL